MGICSSSRTDVINDLNKNSLTINDVNLIRKTWIHVVKGNMETFGSKMMIHIFTEHKDLKPMWKFARSLDTVDKMNASEGIKRHATKLFGAIDAAIGLLEETDKLIPILFQLGYIHYIYGVRYQHFKPIGEALIFTLSDGLQEAFTTEAKVAWLKLINIVVIHMKKGLDQAEKENQAET